MHIQCYDKRIVTICVVKISLSYQKFNHFPADWLALSKYIWHTHALSIYSAQLFSTSFLSFFLIMPLRLQWIVCDLGELFLLNCTKLSKIVVVRFLFSRPLCCCYCRSRCLNWSAVTWIQHCAAISIFFLLLRKSKDKRIEIKRKTYSTSQIQWKKSLELEISILIFI